MPFHVTLLLNEDHNKKHDDMAWQCVSMALCHNGRVSRMAVSDLGNLGFRRGWWSADFSSWMLMRHRDFTADAWAKTMRKLLSGHASTIESWFAGKTRLHSLGDSEETRHAAMFRMEGKREPRLAMYFMCKKTDELWCQLSGKMGCNGCMYFPSAFYSERWRALQNPIWWQSNAANFRSYVYVIHVEISSHLSEGEMFDGDPFFSAIFFHFFGQFFSSFIGGHSKQASKASKQSK